MTSTTAGRRRCGSEHRAGHVSDQATGRDRRYDQRCCHPRHVTWHRWTTGDHCEHVMTGRAAVADHVTTARDVTHEAAATCCDDDQDDDQSLAASCRRGIAQARRQRRASSTWDAVQHKHTAVDKSMNDACA